MAPKIPTSFMDGPLVLLKAAISAPPFIDFVHLTECHFLNPCLAVRWRSIHTGVPFLEKINTKIE